jgi:hypothetical protein
VERRRESPKGLPSWRLKKRCAGVWRPLIRSQITAAEMAAMWYSPSCIKNLPCHLLVAETSTLVRFLPSPLRLSGDNFRAPEALLPKMAPTHDLINRNSGPPLCSQLRPVEHESPLEEP